MDEETMAPIDDLEAFDAVEDEDQFGDALPTTTQNLQLC